MPNDNEYMDVVVPIDVNGKTIWHKVGTAFPNSNPNKKHKMVISMISIPLSMFTNQEVKMFVFSQEDRRPRQAPLPRMAPRDDTRMGPKDDVDF